MDRLHNYVESTDMRISQIIFILIMLLFIYSRKDYWRMAKTILTVYAICVFWQFIEIVYYGEVQNREVDNIIAVIMIPFIYRSIERTKDDD